MATFDQLTELAESYLEAGDIQSTEFLLEMIEKGEYQDETTTAGLAFETAKAIPRGFGKGLLSSGAGLAGLANTITDNIGLESLIDEGEDNEGKATTANREHHREALQTHTAPMPNHCRKAPHLHPKGQCPQDRQRR